MTETHRSAVSRTVEPPTGGDGRDGLADRLRMNGADYDDAVRELHVLMLRAARHQAAQMPGAYTRLGHRRVEDAVTAAADEATMAVLSRLDTFEGRSRFTTWAYKFGILHAAAELRRSDWRHVEIDLAGMPEPASTMTSPEQHAENSDLLAGVRAAINSQLTTHQRAIVIALLVDNVPVDVLAERLSSSRNALYKTLHDARKRLRADLMARGYLTETAINAEVMS